MVTRYYEKEEDAIERIVDADGYRFNIRGNLNETQLKTWINVIKQRLVADGVIDSSANVSEVIYIKQHEKQIIPKTELKRSSEGIINFWDYVRMIDSMIVYIVIDEVLDEDLYSNLEPLILDCETIESLFDADGNYIGSSRSIDEYIVM